MGSIESLDAFIFLVLDFHVCVALSIMTFASKGITCRLASHIAYNLQPLCGSSLDNNPRSQRSILADFPKSTIRTIENFGPFEVTQRFGTITFPFRQSKKFRYSATPPS